MKRLWIIYTQELKNAFHSFLAYILLAFFMAITSYFFVTLVAQFSLISQRWKATAGAPEMAFNLTEMVLTGLFVNVACLALFFIPLLTMRSFCEEKKQGTLELLLTLPVRDYQVVFGKFLSLFTLYLLMITPLLLLPLLVRHAGGYFEWGTVLTGLLGLVLVGACFISCGIFASSLTDNQVISAVISFGILIILWMIGWLENFSDLSTVHWAGHLSLFEHFKSLAKGIIDLKDVAYYSFLSVFFLYATLLSLESRALAR